MIERLRRLWYFLFPGDPIIQLIRHLAAARRKLRPDRRHWALPCVYVQEGERLLLIGTCEVVIGFKDPLTWEERGSPGREVVILKPWGFHSEKPEKVARITESV
jgi:hypothetical protein